MTKSINRRASLKPSDFADGIWDHLRFTRSKDLSSATKNDIYHAVSMAVRDRLVHRWIATQNQYAEQRVKRVHYLSAEYLLGRQLDQNLLNLGLRKAAESALKEKGFALEEILEEEPDPGLGNGGLGRLAACFMDSLATLGLPGMGYGIRYEFGIFRQEIDDGWQVEHPDDWLRQGNPWELVRPEKSVTVRFGGRVEPGFDQHGHFRPIWVGGTEVIGVPYDTPIAGYQNGTVHNLRLWRAKASEQFDLTLFNEGDFRKAVADKAISESISKVLYPKDDSPEGKELRLKQQYFFVCCSIHDLVSRYLRQHDTFDAFADLIAIQLNDTHPAVTVTELMRVLLDEHGLSWDRSWELVVRCTAYTNHTLMPEALEVWSLELFRALLPRHTELLFEIDRRFRREIQLYRPGDEELEEAMAIVSDGHVRMANLSVVGSHTVNGVAKLHGELLKERVLNDFATRKPEQFTYVTNGITPRRWLLQCNPLLSDAITERIGAGWIRDLSKLSELNDYTEDASWLSTLRQVKQINKKRVARRVLQTNKVLLNPDHLFDVQVKRIHEYKRQLMLCLFVVDRYIRLKFGGERLPPRVVMLGGKAAPGYFKAKQHIKLICDVGRTIAADPAVRDRLQLVFLPNYNVSFAEIIVPGTDLSEQISMAGKEASGTGNMKFMLNGAATIGTLDGANVEIRQAAGEENFFAFGLDAEQAAAPNYHPKTIVSSSPRLRRVLDLVASGFFSPDDRGTHQEVVMDLLHQDTYRICADFLPYCESQDQVEAAYADQDRWARIVAKNIANAGFFSSDRSIEDYGRRIWGLTPVKITP